MPRISENECFLEMTKILRKRSTCRRRQYASIIVKYTKENKRGFILSSGYNGVASGLPNCSDSIQDCKRITENVPHNEKYIQSDCNAVHSEINACLQAGRERLGKNCVLYLSGFDLIENKEVVDPKPCKNCENIMRNMGIERYVNNTGEHFLEKNMGIFSGRCGNE